MRKRPSIMGIISVAVLTLLGEAPIKAEDSRVETALAAAEAWLELVDDGEYAESWEEAAAYFRGAVQRDDWQQTMKGARSPLGEVVSRELMEAKYRSRLAGAPDGEYVVIRFKTSFSNKADALETVTPMLDPDGRWRVSGYYFK
jgi:hypothetical protein